MRRLPARLYLVKSSGRAPNWVIRDGSLMIRTGAHEHETDKARDALHAHMFSTGELVGTADDIDYQKPVNAAPSIIYFLTCDAPDFPIKIGVASNLTRRVSHLQNALPFKIIVLATLAGSLLDERRLHRKFRHLKLRGEWFSRGGDLIEFIDAPTLEVLP